MCLLFEISKHFLPHCLQKLPLKLPSARAQECLDVFLGLAFKEKRTIHHFPTCILRAPSSHVPVSLAPLVGGAKWSQGNVSTPCVWWLFYFAGYIFITAPGPPTPVAEKWTRCASIPLLPENGILCGADDRNLWPNRTRALVVARDGDFRFPFFPPINRAKDVLIFLCFFPSILLSLSHP